MLDPITGRFDLMATFIDGAWLALGTFFAISGFVLTLRYRTATWSPGSLLDYGFARIARVYPVYLLSLVILAPIIAGELAAGDLGGVADRAALLLNYGLILQGWTRLPVDWNTPAWSLSCELFFYAWFPLLIFLLRKLSWRRVVLVVLVGFAVPVALRLAGVPTVYKPLIYFGDFVVGIGAAGLYQLLNGEHGKLAGRGDRLYLPAALCALGLLLFAQREVPFLVFDSALRLANGLMVIGLAWGGGWAAGLLSSPRTVWAGRASYAIYILHVPLLWWYKRSLMYATLPDVAAGVLYMTVVVLFAGMVCDWYERPMEQKLRQSFCRWSSRRKEARTLAATPGATISEQLRPVSGD
jgi:peptidoglycan/LPS O-acetylase OafA/YrhL